MIIGSPPAAGPDPTAPGLDDDEDLASAPERLTSPEGEEAPEVRQRVLDGEAHGMRLDKVLVTLAPEFSRTHLQTLIERGLVQVEGQVCRLSSRRLQAGQAVTVALAPTEQAQAFKPQPMDLQIVYEDEHLMVLDKPAGLVVHPAPGHWSGTLLNGLLAHHNRAAELPRAGIVHRLDKDTTGLMVVAKSAAAQQGLTAAIAARTVRRIYWALAHGTPDAAVQTVDAPIGRDPLTRVRMAVVRGGRPSQTTVEVLGSDAQGHAALQCTLHTGRTHQIRVHMAHLGHPLVGDALYGGKAWGTMHRQALHARHLALEHPVTGQPMAWSRPLPMDLAAAWPPGLATG